MKYEIGKVQANSFLARCIEHGVMGGRLDEDFSRTFESNVLAIVNTLLESLENEEKVFKNVQEKFLLVFSFLNLGLEYSSQCNVDAGVQQLLASDCIEKCFRVGFSLVLKLHNEFREKQKKFCIASSSMYPIREEVRLSENRVIGLDDFLQNHPMYTTTFRDLQDIRLAKEGFTRLLKSIDLLALFLGSDYERQVAKIFGSEEYFWYSDSIIRMRLGKYIDIWFLLGTVLVNVMVSQKPSLAQVEKNEAKKIFKNLKKKGAKAEVKQQAVSWFAGEYSKREDLLPLVETAIDRLVSRASGEDACREIAFFQKL